LNARKLRSIPAVEGESPAGSDSPVDVDAYHERVQRLRKMQQGQRGGQQGLPIEGDE